MDAAAELGRNPVSTRFSQSMEKSRLTRDGTAEPISRDQIPRHERGQGDTHFSCSADHEQDWQPYLVDPYSCYMYDHTYIHTYITADVLNLTFRHSSPCSNGVDAINTKVWIRSDFSYLQPPPQLSYSTCSSLRTPFLFFPERLVG